MGGHRQHPAPEFLDVGRLDLHTVNRRQHLQDPLSKRKECRIETRQGDSIGVQYQLVKPLSHYLLIPKNPLEKRADRFNVDQGFIDVENQNRWLSPRIFSEGLCSSGESARGSSADRCKCYSA